MKRIQLKGHGSLSPLTMLFIWFIDYVKRLKITYVYPIYNKLLIDSIYYIYMYIKKHCFIGG